MKLTFLIVTFFKQIILSLYFSCAFCGTNQVVSVFILYLIVYENLACSFLKGYGEITTVICSTDQV